MFEPTVDSLRNYECPEWFRDAKFGIYVHWGVYSVAEQGEWYPHQMYMQGTRQHQYHCKLVQTESVPSQQPSRSKPLPAQGHWHSRTFLL